MTMPATSDNDADGPAAASAPAPSATTRQEPPGRDGRGAPEPGDAADVAAGDAAGLTFRAFAWRWLVTFGLLLTFSVAWILVTPPIGGPDEQAHAVKAAAVASGQLTTQPDVPRGGGYRLVRVPLRLAHFEDLRGCFAFQPTVSADCAPSLEGSSRVGEVTTSAGLSPPLYYALVGAPLRLSPDL